MNTSERGGSSMPVDHVGAFARELWYQADTVRLAHERLDALFRRASVESGLDAAAFAAGQSILGAAAAISRTLWPARSAYKTRGEALRGAFQIAAGEFPVLSQRKLRDKYEHFDEVLDEYLATNPPIIRDRSFVIADNMMVNWGDQVIPHLRLIVAVDRKVALPVLGLEVNIDELLAEVERVVQLANNWKRRVDAVQTLRRQRIVRRTGRLGDPS